MNFQNVFQLLLIVASYMISVTYCIRQTLTIYPKPNFQGESITLRDNYERYPNMDKYMTNESSYIAAGWWNCYSPGHNGPSTERQLGRNAHAAVSYPNGINLIAYTRLPSCHYLGAADTYDNAITLYRSPNSCYCITEGPCISITTPETSRLPWDNSTMITFSLVTNGYSNWTLYTGENFNGNSTCYIPSQTMHLRNLYEIGPEESTVGSVRRGCAYNPHKYVYL